MKTLLTTTAVGLLLALSPAHAQTDKTPGSQPQSPGASATDKPSMPGSAAPEAGSPGSTSPGMSSPGTASPQTGAGEPTAGTTDLMKSPDTAAASDKEFFTEQEENHRLASKLMGQSVRGQQDESIGDISDLLIDDQGQVVAVVIGVGGFLGIGQKNVAINFDQIQVSQENGELRVVAQLSKEELESAPEFKEREAAGATSPATDADRPGAGTTTPGATPSAPDGAGGAGGAGSAK